MRGSRIVPAVVALLGVASSAMGAECGPLKRITTLDMMKLPSGRYAVSVEISGKQETLLLDTGGAFSQLSQKTVKDLNLPTTRSRDGKGLVDVSGATSDQQVRLPSITLGGLRQEGAYFFVSPQQPNAPQNVPEFAGILAADFLQNFDVDFDFDTGKLNLFSPDHCDGNVVYWRAATVAVVPFTFDASGHINFRMDLDGKRVNATLDTGAARTTLNLDTAQREFGVDLNGPDVEKVGQLQGGFAANVYRRRFKTLGVDGVNVSNPVVILLPDLVSGRVRNTPAAGSLIRDEKVPDMLVGMPTLSQLHLYIAYKERKLYMTASFAPPQPAQAAQPAPAAPAPVAQADAFCPAPAEMPAGTVTPPASPNLSAGMAAFQRRDFSLAYANIRPVAEMGNHEAERDLGIVLRQSCGRGNDKANAAA
ncbi:MAG TPA: retroviral-like aspartic protease family protein, partial [Micropepsaceae bacterium]|nr:retroviral-like aspartic protease family protein [Micropepsaceae bacterium]